MRNIVIAVGAIIVLVLVGLGVKYGWQAVHSSSSSDAAYDQLTTTGVLSGSARDDFIAQGVQGCEAKRPDSVSADAFKQYCVCAMNKAADLITSDEARAVQATGNMPDTLATKMQEPVKQCLKAAGLLPAQ